jgi:hypothetical protein
MRIGAATCRPMILRVRLFGRKVIDARKPRAHQATLAAFSILVAIQPIPDPSLVMPFVCKPDGYVISGESPKLFDNPGLQLLCPLPSDALRASHKL